MKRMRSKLTDFIRFFGDKAMSARERDWLDAIDNPTTRPGPAQGTAADGKPSPKEKEPGRS